MQPQILRLLAGLLIPLLLAAPLTRGAGTPASPAPGRFSAAELAQGYSSSRLIVKPRSQGAGFDDSVERSLNLGLHREHPLLNGMRVLDIPAETKLADVIAALQASGHYEFVALDRIRSTRAIPNDPNFSQQWSLRNTGTGGSKVGADIGAVNAWDTRSSASTVIVAVIDSGLYLQHPDIAANLWTNPGEVAGDGIDNDRNGYIDDLHGINSIVASSTAAAGNPGDDHGHGTHVAGIIGAVGNNGTGIAGVAWQVRIMPLKFLGSDGRGSLSDALECLSYAIAHGARIINASFGGDSSDSGFSKAELDAVKAARDQGVILVCAAGNDAADTDQTPNYPGNYPVENIVTVSNSTNLDDMAPSSNRGSGSCDLFAPGSEILSLGHVGAGSAYVSKTGTSMSAPHVAGALALLKAQYPADNYRELINRLLRGTSKVAAFDGKCQTGGRLNLAQALAMGDKRPFNDDFSSRARLAGSVVSVRSCNIGATAEAADPAVAGLSTEASLWFEWTASSNGSVTVDTAGSTYDTLLGVYTGATQASLSLVASNDNSSGVTSRLSFSAVAGTSYRILVGSKTGGSGLLLMSLGSVPAHDNFSSARVLTGLSPLAEDTNSIASREPNEPSIAGLSTGKSLWYRWTAPATRSYEFAAFTSAFKPLLAVYTGSSLTSLTELASFSSDTASPSLRFNATEGQTYLLCVNSQSSDSSGPFTLSLVDNLWHVPMGDVITNAPAVGPGGVVYCADGKDTLIALNSDGTTRWTHTLSYGMDSSGIAVAPDGSVLFPDSLGNVTSLRPDGTVKWTLAPGGTINNAPAIAASGAVAIKSNNGILYSLSGDTGTVLWSYNTQATDSYGAPSIGSDGTLYVGDGDGTLHAVNGTTGTRRWSFAADGAIFTTPAIAADGGVLFATTAGGVYKLSTAGAQVWYRNIGAAITSSPAIAADGTVHFAAYDAKLYALDGTDGTVRWTYPLGSEVRASSPAVAADGTVYVGSYDKRLWAVAPGGGSARAYSTGGWLRSSPVIAGSRLYVGSNDRKLYAFELPTEGTAASSWPQRAADAARSGRARINTPVITAQPDPFPAFLGRVFTLGTTASGSDLSYQWFKDGQAIIGATLPSFSLASPQSSDAGIYAVVVSSPTGSTFSNPVTIQVLTANPGRIVNLSARGVIPTSAGTFTIGFVVKHGSQPKPLLIRGLGPTLQPLVGVHALTNPALKLFNDAQVQIGENDNWVSSNELLQATSSFTGLPLLSASTDAAILGTLSGLNTCIINDQGGDTGLTLAELYDADGATGETPATGRLVNISARNHVGTDNEILVAGFVINGNVPKKVLIRGIGPALQGFGVQGFLADPEIRLFQGSTLYRTNDNWGGTAELSAAFTSTEAFPLAANSLDAALLVTLPPGSYTVELRGVGNSTGNGMVEVYEVTP